MDFSWVKVGAKCVLRKEFEVNYKLPFEILPKLRIAYTIRDIIKIDDITSIRNYEINKDNHVSIGIRLKEIINPKLNYRNDIDELTFDARAFAPLVVKTEQEDIDMFNTIASLSFLRDNLKNEVI